MREILDTAAMFIGCAALSGAMIAALAAVIDAVVAPALAMGAHHLAAVELAARAAG